MVDIPGDSTTTRTLAVGGSVTDSLETIGDHDWFRIQLSAGQSVSVSLDGLTLEDSYLRIRDSNGNVLFENDDIASGTNRDSLLAFSATYSGTYYIDVGAWDEKYTGSYELKVTPYTPPPIYSVDQAAYQLTNGYWGGASHRFAVSSGGTLNVNLTGLTSAGQDLARAALSTWTDIIGVRFAEVASGGQIVFDDDGEGAFSTGIWSGGIISSAEVNVSSQWLTDYGTALNGYAFQTYIHEIGHALGLGHAGNYNEEARYPFDATFQNDGWPMTIMSYFDQRENTYFAGLGFTHNFVVTPMMADIVAITNLYGRSTTTRTGDSVYGPGWTTNTGTLSIFDSAGNDTIDVSGSGASQRIDLNAGTFSNVLGEVGNISIAPGVLIENAIGGSGADTLIGNDVANILDGGAGSDTLTGRGGSDLFRGTTAGMNGDTITDFAAGDRIVFTNAALSGFSYALSGSTLTYSGGSLTLTGYSGPLSASTAAEGGVQLASGLSAPTATGEIGGRYDFNGDGRSDILWRQDGGLVTDWLGTASGGFANNHANSATTIPTDWRIVGTGDFNGDGRDDILWRHNGGTITDWLGTASGGFVNNHAYSASSVPNDWGIAGIGDFNGDGRSDILWRHSSGTLTDWLGTASGGFVNNHGNSAASVPADWNVVGTGDFNGDGRDDILWRHDGGQVSEWLGTASGGFANNHAVAAFALATTIRVAGVGDFNGDGRDDILLRSDNGTFTTRLGNANGSFTVNDMNFSVQRPIDWAAVGTGDYNGDGRDDILWRDGGGRLTEWLGTASGGFVSNEATVSVTVPLDWQVQSPDAFWI